MLSNRLFRPRARLALLPLFALLGGCASGAQGDFPSLAKRPVEGTLTVAPPVDVPLPPPPPATGDLAARIAALVQAAEGGDAAFRGASAAAETAAGSASGAGVSSESWVVAHQAISRLDAARAPSTAALADLDAMLIARSDSGERDGMADLTSARDAVAAMVSAQNARIGALVERLRKS